MDVFEVIFAQTREIEGRCGEADVPDQMVGQPSVLSSDVGFTTDGVPRPTTGEGVDQVRKIFRGGLQRGLCVEGREAVAEMGQSRG